MNNKFSTVISYERPLPSPQAGSGVSASRDLGATIRALAFMVLWLVLTVFLLAEPLMSNMKTAHVRHDAASISIQLGTAVAPAPESAAPPHQLGLRHAPTNLNAGATVNQPNKNQPAQLSYALLTL